MSGGTTTSYLYDADGWRVRKTTSTDTTLYLRGLNGELLTEWKNPGSTRHTKEYIYAGSRLLAAIDRDRSTLPTTCGGNAWPDGSPQSLSVPSGGTATSTFEDSACRRVSVVITASTIGSCGSIFHEFKLLKPDGNQLAVGSGVCAGTMIESPVLPVSGNYRVVVDPSGSSAGDVTLTVYDLTDVTGVATLGQAMSATLTTPGQRALWTFTGTANQRVSAVINSSTITSCGSASHRMRLLKPDGNELTSAISLCANDMIDAVTLPTPGVYTLVIDPYGTTGGQIQVTLHNVMDAGGPLTLGQPMSATLTTPGQRALWTFTGSANQRVSALVNSSTITSCGSAYHRMRLLKPDGNELASAISLCANDMIDVVSLPTPGVYTLVIDPYGTTGGQIAVTLYDVVDTTGPIAVNGSSVTAPLTSPGAQAIWTFDGTSSAQVRVVIDSSTIADCSLLYHAIKIVKPDGNTLTSNYNLCEGGVVGPSALSAPGVYKVVVDPYTRRTGTITVRLVSP
jgi:hypothetical protein